MASSFFSSNEKEEQEEVKIQKVIFVRHGVARHNLLDPRTGQRPNLEDPNLFDPPLVLAGKQQALKAGEQLQLWWHTTQLGEKVELIVTSPLTRCIQTSVLAFLPGDNYYSTTTTTSTNDEDYEEISNIPKIVCVEAVREAYGMHYPDRRRDKSTLMKHWPLIDFNDENMSQEDTLWKSNERESIEQLQKRIQYFFDNWLINRMETNIVIFSHGVWIETCLNTYCPEVLGSNNRVYNCDCYFGECVSTVNGKFLRLQNFRKI